MNESPDLSPRTENPGPGSGWRKLAWGSAVVAIPLGTILLYAYLQKSTDARNRAQEAGAAYDDSALRQVNPALITYREVEPWPTGLKSPRAVTVDNAGLVYIGGDKQVRVFSTAKEPQREIPLSDTPYSLAVGPDGKLYVGLKDHVEVFAPDGQSIAVWPSPGQRSYLTSLAVAKDEVYVADAGQRIVWRYDLDGKVRGELAQADAARGLAGLVVPSPHLDVAVARDGVVWVANPGRHRLEAYLQDGELQRFWGRAGTAIECFQGCCNPSDFVLLSDGRFVTSEKGVPRIKVYLPDGRLDGVVAGPEAFGDYSGSLDLAVDRDGRVLVLQPGPPTVRVFARKE